MELPNPLIIPVTILFTPCHLGRFRRVCTLSNSRLESPVTTAVVGSL